MFPLILLFYLTPLVFIGGGLQKFTVVLIWAIAASVAASLAASLAAASRPIQCQETLKKIHPVKSLLDPGCRDVKNVFQFLLVFAHNLLFCSSIILIEIPLCQTSCPLRTVHSSLAWQVGPNAGRVINYRTPADRCAVIYCQALSIAIVDLHS